MRKLCSQPECTRPAWLKAKLCPGGCHFHEALAAMLELERGRFKADNFDDRERVAELQAVIYNWLTAERIRLKRKRAKP